MQGDVFRRESSSRYPDWQYDHAEGPWAAVRNRPGIPSHSGIAVGAIYPSRFVVLVAPGKIRQAKTGDTPWGVTQEQTRNDPYRPSTEATETRAAADGDDVFVYGFNAADVPLTLGGPVAIGNRLTTDDQGRGIVATSGTWAMAIAEEPGDAGQVRKANLIPAQRVR
jgi:hypothetical protein